MSCFSLLSREKGSLGLESFQFIFQKVTMKKIISKTIQFFTVMYLKFVTYMKLLENTVFPSHKKKSHFLSFQTWTRGDSENNSHRKFCQMFSLMGVISLLLFNKNSIFNLIDYD